MLSSHTLLRFEVHPHKVENLHRLGSFREGWKLGVGLMIVEGRRCCCLVVFNDF